MNYTDGKYNDYAVQDYLEGVKDNVARLAALGLGALSSALFA